MSFKVVVRSNIADIARQVQEDARDQVPFATALALTWTAKDAQKDLIESLPDYFTLRSKWAERSIRVQMTKKGHDPEVKVGSLFERLREQALGGPRQGSDAIPYRARRTPTSTTSRRASWPQALLAHREAYFALKGRSVGGGTLIYQRVGRGGRRLRLWWVLGSVVLKPRWPFQALVEGAISRELETNFWAALERAIATRKPRVK